MTPSYLLSDIDGVLTDSQGELDVRAIEKIRRLESSGVPVGLVSGRPYPVVRALGEFIGTTGPLIAENGGIALVANREIRLGSRSAIEAAIDVLRREFGLSPTWDDGFRATDFAFERSIDEMELKDYAQRRHLELEIQVSSIMIHMAQPGVTKYAATKLWREAECVDADVAFAGDSDSDLSMFSRLRITFAPANCTANVRRSASFVSKKEFGDGFCDGVDAIWKAE